METSTAPTGRPSQVKRWLRHVLTVVSLAAVVLATWELVAPRSSPINYLFTPEGLPAIPRPQRPRTLDPAEFSGAVAEGYRIAKERPALLEQMPCYCGCYLKDGHQNNLDCFRDRHGETCPMCLEIARRAAELEKAGYAPEDIKKMIDRRFAPRTP